jgi:hypothetical protein
MTRIAIVGAGIAGSSAALALAKRGVEVSLYSDRSLFSLRNEVPATGTAVIVAQALQAERDMGLRTYLDVAPLNSGTSVRVVAEPDVELIAFDASFDGFTAEAVDTRLKATDRIAEFIAAGGAFVVEAVDADRLDEIAAEHDLTLVATGKAGLRSLFARDESRSVFDRPQRSLLMLTVVGPRHDETAFAHRSAVGAAHSAISFVGDKGEAWWGPYYHKDAGACWSFLGWAKPGSEWERRFAAATSAETALEIVQTLHRDFLPWDLPEALEMRVIAEDPHSWLTGAVTPEVRSGVGWTKSGRPVAALGDAAIAYDPIGGQGAQSSLIQASIYVDRIAAWEGQFDERWIDDAFETFYARRAAGAELATRLFLGHPSVADFAQLFMSAANASERFASRLFGLLNDPQPLLGLRSSDDARALVTQFAGEDVDILLARSKERIERAEEAHANKVPYFSRSRRDRH